jgi:hypothetical protein
LGAIVPSPKGRGSNARDYREAPQQSQIEVSRSANAALYFERTNAMKKEKISELTT